MIEQELMDLIKQLDELDRHSRMRLISRVDEQRHELLGILLKQLGTSTSKNVQAAVIYFIGRHRLSEGVQDLIQWIDFDAGHSKKIRPLPLWDKYPAMEALINIGRPAVPKAIELLATDTVDIRRDLAVKVIRYVEDADLAEFIVQRAYAEEKDSVRKANFKDALSRLENLVQKTQQ